MRLEEKIDDEVYFSKHNLMENEIKEFLERKSELKSSDVALKTQIMLELTGSFYTSYFRASKE